MQCKQGYVAGWLSCPSKSPVCLIANLSFLLFDMHVKNSKMEIRDIRQISEKGTSLNTSYMINIFIHNKVKLANNLYHNKCKQKINKKINLIENKNGI